MVRIQIFQFRTTSVGLNAYSGIQTLVVAVLFALLVIQRDTSLKTIFTNRLFCNLSFLYSLGMVSIIWSALPAFSFYMAFQNLVFLSAIFYLASLKDSFADLESFLIKSSLLFMLIALLGDIYRYGFSIIFGWHHLEIGGVGAMLLCYSVGEIVYCSSVLRFDPQRKKLLWRTAIGGFIILIWSTSSGANVSSIIGLLSLAFVGKNKTFKIVAFLIIMVFTLIPDSITSVLPFIFPGKSSIGITSVGYRMHLWESLWELTRQKPILGWGYAAIERINQYYAIDSHNSIIGIIGGLGFVGGFLLVSYIIIAFVKIYKNRYIAGYTGLFGGFMCLLADSNTIGFLSSKTSLLTIAFFTIVVISYFYQFYPYNNSYDQD